MADVQMGFRRGVGTRDQIFNLRIIMEKAREASVPLYMAFIDYKKAFDSVNHRKLWSVLKEMGMCNYTVDAIKNLYSKQQAAVRVEKELTEWFRIGKGARQGCLVSPLSFNCYSEYVMRESADELGWIGVTISGRTINNLRYADDIVLIATSAAALQQLIDRVNEVSKEYGLEINIKKTKVMVVAKTRETVQLTCNGEYLEQVEVFRYLGALIDDTGDGSKEMKARLGMARTTMSSLDCLWRDRSVSNMLKRRVMEAMVWSVALYGSEAWTLKAADRRRLTAFEMMTYRRMLRVDWREHRTNVSILTELQPKQRLLETVQRRKLRYFGHLMRADNISTLLLQGRIEGTRARGRPRRRWVDDIRDWTGLSLVDCARRAQDREGWRKLLSLPLVSNPQE